MNKPLVNLQQARFISKTDSLTAKMLSLIFRKTDDMFEVYATIDIAAENNKISGNELRDIIYNEAKTYQKIGEHTVDLREFSITNLKQFILII